MQRHMQVSFHWHGQLPSALGRRFPSVSSLRQGEDNHKFQGSVCYQTLKGEVIVERRQNNCCFIFALERWGDQVFVAEYKTKFRSPLIVLRPLREVVKEAR